MFILYHTSILPFWSRGNNCSRVTGTFVQQTVVQESLTRLFKSSWHDCSIVTRTIVQQLLARLFIRQDNLSFSALTRLVNGSVEIEPPENWPLKNCPPSLPQKVVTYENCSLWKHPPTKVPSYENNPPFKNCPKENYPPEN